MARKPKTPPPLPVTPPTPRNTWEAPRYGVGASIIGAIHPEGLEARNAKRRKRVYHYGGIAILLAGWVVGGTVAITKTDEALAGGGAPHATAGGHVVATMASPPGNHLLQRGFKIIDPQGREVSVWDGEDYWTK